MANKDVMQMIYIGELELNSFYLEAHQKPGSGDLPMLHVESVTGPKLPSKFLDSVVIVKFRPYRQQTWEVLLCARKLRVGLREDLIIQDHP